MKVTYWFVNSTNDCDVKPTKIWSIGSVKKIAIILVSLLFIASVVLYHTPLATKVCLKEAFAANATELKTSTEVYRKRLKFHGTRRRLPQSIVIGVRKCGTRALIEMLALHPYIMRKSVEMHFFDDEEVYANGLEWYRKKMPYSFDSQITVEKTPSYFVSKEAPQRIHAMDDQIKLLLIVRDPTARVVSDYTQIAEQKRMKGKEVLELEERVFTEEGDINESYKAIQVSQYFVHMVRWLRVFQREQIHIVNGDRLITDPYYEMKKVEQFLQLPPRFVPGNFYYNHTKGFFCFRNETMKKCLPPSKGRQHPEVSPETLNRLRRYFVPFNDHFYDLVGFNFSWPVR